MACMWWHKAARALGNSKNEMYTSIRFCKFPIYCIGSKQERYVFDTDAIDAHSRELMEKSVKQDNLVLKGIWLVQ